MPPVQRPYRSRRVRPCDRCRKRKSGCVIDGEPPCQLCAKFNLRCEFTDKAPPVNRHKLAQKNEVDVSPVAELEPVDPMAGVTYTDDADVLEKTFDPKTLERRNSLHADQLIPDAEIWNELFGLIVGSNQYSSVAIASPVTTRDDDEHSSIDAFKKYQNVYLYKSGYIDPVVQHLSKNLESTKPKECHMRKVAQVGIPEYVLFSRKPTNYDVPGINSLIQQLFSPHIPKLMVLFLKHVNSYFPVFSRGRFNTFAKQDTKVFPSALFGSLLAVTADWWHRHPELSLMECPAVESLVSATRATILSETSNPCYGTLQSCLLLSQKLTLESVELDATQELSLLSVAFTICQSMGINVECRHWNIPDWEKRVRRRLWWTLFVQEKWLSTSLGRASLISKEAWNLSLVDGADFAFYPDSWGSQEQHEYEVRIFSLVVSVTMVIDGLGDLNIPPLIPAYDRAKALLQRIDTLRNENSEIFNLDQILSGGRSAAALVVATLTAKVLIYSALLRLMETESREDQGARPRIEQECLALTSEALEILGRLRPHHFESFWYSWSRFNFATIANFFLLVSRLCPPSQSKAVEANMAKLRFFFQSRSLVFRHLSLAMWILNVPEY
ncbi:hypothetical protein KL942_005372 [Ogataea angusta]|uniref:Zn(2)-C6 fungal-type domain-containing protein n=1 Tax=Pichia angusta TaxID=870730 RepID=A0ABQ7RPE7_PICAN|nr:hypothetical protein KL942_005372 [Ogataea angusta]KAG7845024.1 hypothetical protein KL940_005349 [Ogataea angusta]